jgi:hypothetical protein
LGIKFILWDWKLASTFFGEGPSFEVGHPALGVSVLGVVKIYKFDTKVS